jgi:Protein tyrosine and serine/threonine kinase
MQDYPAVLRHKNERDVASAHRLFGATTRCFFLTPLYPPKLPAIFIFSYRSQSASSQNDLLDLFKLEAVVTSKCTTHIEYRTDRARGIRNERVEKKWYKKQCIGNGGFGKVWLEATQDDDDDVEKRTVEIINKAKMRPLRVDYNKELLALAKFSKQEEVLVKFFGWFEDSLNLFLSMEYFELGDLEHN